MNIEVCKNCKFYSLDTLVDGTKEHYCYPPYFTHMIAFSVPCKKRTEEECNMILKAVDELPWVTVGNWKPVEAKEIGKPQEKIEVANFESDWRKNAVYLEDDCK